VVACRTYDRQVTARWITTIGASAAATVVALSLGGASRSDTAAQRQRVAVEDCSTRSQARFPGGFTARRNLVVGPLAMIGAGRRAHFDPVFGGQKFQLLVRNGHRVTVELPRRARRGAGLGYGPLPSGEVGWADAHRAVRFIACRRGVSPGSSADGRPVTFWSGGVLALSARCVPLRIFVDGAREPRRAVIRLGVRGCQSGT
jgi:hypothetical protein